MSNKTVVSNKTISDKTVVIFNSPANSGKDISTQYMKDYFCTGEVIAFKDELYKDTASYFDIDAEDLIEYHNDRSLKEKPSLLFAKYQRESLKQYFFSLLYVIGALINNRYLMSLGYYSSREALIHVSEDVIKPVKGKDYYGKRLVEKIEDSSERFYFVSDSGYFEEASSVADKGYRVIIAQLIRSGAPFEGDSRSLLNKDDFKEYSNIKFCQIDNNSSLDDLYNSIVDLSYDVVLDSVKERYGGTENEYEIVHI